ncbi:MAG: exodeoxyribonuclease VII large subunit [Thermoanaerobacterales bacterium]|nr:exodeoxyribonuclease VII large subunit [Thermoanaerobacterales bacterium]
MRIVGVSELTAYLKERLEGDPFLANVWVRGEVCNCHYHSSGHVYFALREKGALLRAVMFRSRAGRHSFRLQNGLAVVARGAIGLYERDGQYQLYVEEVEPEGVGAYYAALEQLKARLQAEGLFDERRKRPLPALPLRIGLVTSPVGAAVRDVITIAAKRWPLAEIVLAPVSVQGDSAPYEIARGIRMLNGVDGIDVIVVGRGGGAPEELWAFNTEMVARAIFHSRVPVVSAVGHEKDVTIADLVADRRAATPSAAAELLCPDRMDVARYLTGLAHRLARAVNARLDRGQHRLSALLRSRALARPVETVCGQRHRAVDLLAVRLRRGAEAVISRRSADLGQAAARLDPLSPLATLARGYSICRREADGAILRDAAMVGVGEKVGVLLHSGRLRCTVSAVETEQPVPGPGL